MWSGLLKISKVHIFGVYLYLLLPKQRVKDRGWKAAPTG
jgi:hypothetical protein